MDKNNKTAEEHKALMLLKAFQNELFLRLYKPEHDQLNEIIDLVIEMENQISSDWYISIINKEQKKRINELDERIKELEGLLKYAYEIICDFDHKGDDLIKKALNL